MNSINIKAEAHRLIDNLPDSITWDDLVYHVDVRRAIEAGLDNVRNGRTIPEEEVWKEFDLPQ
jgi:hypothetical protein